MENTRSKISPQNFNTPCHLPPNALLTYPRPQLEQATPASQGYPSQHHIDPSLHSLGHNDYHDGFEQPIDESSVQQQQQQQLDEAFATPDATQQQHSPRVRLQQLRPQLLTSHPQSHHAGHDHGRPSHHAVPSAPQYGISTLHPPLLPTPQFRQEARDAAIQRMQSENKVHQKREDTSGDRKMNGRRFAGMRSITDPPHLDNWRQKLFDVDGTITLTEEEFQTYFPHVDNVYSHRSTQEYKRKPFVSHYWDCRLKGRPPGTAKSDDPNKKKRKRLARERDLCDVKIKITEYFPGVRAVMAESGEAQNDSTGPGDVYSTGGRIGLGVSNNSSPVPGANGERYYTISRVNGSNANGRGEVVPGAHQHTLEDSDRVKKNSIQRQQLKNEKERKKSQKNYHKRATGSALQTVKEHSKDGDLKIYGSCFCPFVQRVWISMEHKELQYQYIEVDPYKKSPSLLAINPLGLIPAMQHGSFKCHESTVLLEYLEDAFVDCPLLPSTAQDRAHARLWADHVNKKIIPAFYHTLQAQDTDAQAANAAELKEHLGKLVGAAHPEGPFFAGAQLGWVDVQLAPWLLRFSRVLGPYRGWPAPEAGSRWARWVDAVETNEHVRNTTSTDELYKDSYERYAENRPETSQVADAVNSGRGLP